MQPHSLVVIVTLVSLLVYFWTGARIAKARSKFGVPAPAIHGHPDFERVFRVQQNTLEWLPIYLPSLWLFAFYWNDMLAAALGLAWIVGRIMYALAYAREAGARGTGFLVQALAAGVLLFGALAGAVMVYAQTGA